MVSVLQNGLTQKEIADKQLQIARENKNKYDMPKKSEKKK